MRIYDQTVQGRPMTSGAPTACTLDEAELSPSVPARCRLVKQTGEGIEGHALAWVDGRVRMVVVLASARRPVASIEQAARSPVASEASNQYIENHSRVTTVKA